MAQVKIAHRANSTGCLVVAQVQLGNQPVIYEKPTGSLDCGEEGRLVDGSYVGALELFV